MSDHDEIWHVRLPNGERRDGTLEQLDEAFHAGAIDESTLVRREGTSEWVTLAQAAGLEPAPAPPPAPVQSAPPPPVVSDLEDLDLGGPALRASKRGVVVGLVAAVAVFATAGIFVARNASPTAGATAGAGAQVEANLAAAAAKAASPTSDLETDGKTRTLTDEQKRALLDLDKAREAEAQKRRAQQQQHYSPPPMKTGSPFARGGNKYDPLNSSL